MPTSTRYWAVSAILTLFISLCCTPLAPHEFAGHLSSKAPVRVLLLTAHPDDECMFFAPTLLGLNAQKADGGDVDGTRLFEAYSVCLSSGDSEGLGKVRKDELQRSLGVLGIPDGRRWILERPFKDNITEYWDTDLVVEYITPYILEHRIDIILTFDRHGISSHPNHISLLRGVQAFLSAQSTTQSTRAFALKTVGILPKYIGQMAGVSSRVGLMACTFIEELATEYCHSKRALTFVSGIDGFLTALHAMTQHKSQLVWFRWLYVLFSRYMWVNEWEEIMAIN